MQKMITNLYIKDFRDDVNKHLNEGWVVVPNTLAAFSNAGSERYIIILAKREEIPSDVNARL